MWLRGAPGAWSDVVVVRSFDELVDEAAAVPVEGWDFSWLDGRATEQRPSWGYQRLLGERLAAATAALDIQTGGGEVLAGAGAENFPPTLVATEGWPPNLAKATALLHPLGAVVVADHEEPPLPFADGALRPGDQSPPGHGPLVGDRPRARTRRHLLRATCRRRHQRRDQRVLPGTARPGDGRDHEVEADQARAAGLEIVQCRNERLQLEFFDVGAMVFFLRKVVWTVPDFTVDRYRDRLRDLHDQIQRDGVFRSTMSRTLFEATKPPLACGHGPRRRGTRDAGRGQVSSLSIGPRDRQRTYHPSGFPGRCHHLQPATASTVIRTRFAVSETPQASSVGYSCTSVGFHRNVKVHFHRGNGMPMRSPSIDAISAGSCSTAGVLTVPRGFSVNSWHSSAASRSSLAR